MAERPVAVAVLTHAKQAAHDGCTSGYSADSPIMRTSARVAVGHRVIRLRRSA
jgi:hypothetical protein